jgi:hypothetical protein
VDGDTVLVLDRTPIRLPEPLARLLAELADQPPPSGWAANSPHRWLFPGIRPGQHVSDTAVARPLAAHPHPHPARPHNRAGPTRPGPAACSPRPPCWASTSLPPSSGANAPPPTGAPTSRPADTLPSSGDGARATKASGRGTPAR